MRQEVQARFTQREQEWGETFQYEEQDVLWTLLRRLGEQLEFLTNPETADAAMKAVWDALPERSEEWGEGESWRAAFNRESVEVSLAEFRAGQVLVLLRQYAEAGLLPREALEESFDGAVATLSRLIAEGSAFRSGLPGDLPGKDLIDRMMMMAEARFALDSGQPLQPEGVALLAGLSVKSVRNAMALKGDEGLETTPDGLVVAESATRWLATKDGFKDSIWKQAVGVALAPQPDPDELSEFVVVPEAKDGGWFRPSDRMTQGWKIGTKENGHYVSDYWQSLDELMRMNIPRWRRPSATSGAHGIVSGVQFRRVLRSDIENELRSLEGTLRL